MSGNTIPRSQAIVMHVVNSHPGISVKDVAITLDVTPSAATQLIDALVKEGIITRHISEQDHRVVTLKLSKEGKVRHRKYKAFQLARLNPILDVLSDDELVEFVRLNRKINTEMKNHQSMTAFSLQQPLVKGK
jgi:DNA-binding MarR family transcriptional regulator